jgi:hypothetical protein
MTSAQRALGVLLPLQMQQTYPPNAAQLLMAVTPYAEVIYGSK